MDNLVGYISGNSDLIGVIEDGEYSLTGSISNNYPVYSGEYVVTPTQSIQVIATGGKLVASNITVNPIPSNYGLVTWNGVTLDIS